jgi:hypothetical protein
MTVQRLDDGTQGDGIEASFHFDAKFSAQVNADSRGALSQPAGNQLKEAPGGRLLFSEPAPPGVKIGRFDLGVSAIAGNAHAACRLILYDGVPMGSSFRSGHRLPPNDNFSLSGSIDQNRITEKTGWSDAYITTINKSL